METTHQRSSLERLKALDNLPDLSAQLEEATKLCTERNRADMIARWILKRLQADASLELEAWKLLLTCFRVQSSPERIGNALASNNIFGIFEAPLNRPEASGELFAVLVEVLEVLLHKATGPHGTFVKAALSAPATSAASFLGAWSRCAHRVLAEKDFNESNLSSRNLISPAATVWEWRKGARDETQSFSQHCLIPASLLLCSDSIQIIGQTLKRKSTESALNTAQRDKQILERLLARHIFAPSRVAFWNTKDKSTSEIRTLLQPLLADDRVPHVLPELLDVALRSSSLSTMRQRVKEAPWTEEIFRALLACNCDEDGDVIKIKVLTQLLATARSHTSLSSATLKSLWERYFTQGKLETLASAPVEQDTMSMDGVRADDPNKSAIPPSWEFVAELVKSNSNIFDEKATRDLFAAIVNYPSRTQSGVPPDWFEEFGQFASQQIVIPIMRAFAKRREIAAFLGIWSHHPELSGVAEAVSEVVEGSMTEQAFINQMQQARAQIETLASNDNSEVNSTSVFMVTNALLAGLRNPKWLDAIHEVLGEMLDVLLDFPQSPSADVHMLSETTRSAQAYVWQEQYWTLLTRMFETWSPSWISSQDNDAQSNEERTLLLKSAAVGAALELVELVAGESSTMKPSPSMALAVGRFLASICSILGGTKSEHEMSCAQLCRDTANRLLQSLGTSSIELLAQYPSLSSMVDSDLRRRCLADSLDAIVRAASSADESEQEDAARLMALQSIATTAANNAQAALLDELIGMLSTILDPSITTRSAKDSASRQELALSMLIDLPIQSLNRTQRQRIIDVLYKCQTAAGGADSSLMGLLNLRLAVMTKLMELPNATCAMSTDPTQIWTLAQSAMSAAGSLEDAVNRTNRDSVDGQAERLATPKLFQELIQLVVGHLLATQDQDKSRTALLGLAGSVRTNMESFQTVKDVQGSAWKLPVIKTMVLRLEAGVRAGLKDQLAYRDQNLLEGFFKLLLDYVSTKVSDPDSVANSTHRTSIQSALETLLDWPAHLVPTFVSEFVQARRQGILVQLLDSCDNSSTPGPDNDKSSWMSRAIDPQVATLIMWFKIGCKYGSGVEDVEFALLVHRILEQRVSPMQRGLLADASEMLVDKLDADNVTTLVKQLYPQVSNVHRHGRFAAPQLIGICLSKLNEASSSKEELSDLRDVLHMLRTDLTIRTDRFIPQMAGDCLVAILKHTPFVVDQHIVEEILLAMLTAVKKPNLSAIVYLEVCNIMATLLLQHRSRLRGRYHLVVKVFQVMTAALFSGLEHHRDTKEVNPTVACARRLARLIVLFCEPPQSRKAVSSTSLMDEARKEQANVGQHVQNLLHSYCSQVLASSTVIEGLRDALTPAIWSVIEAMEINDGDGIKALGAAMNNSERAVLRDVYGDWRRFGKWRGG